MGLKNPKHCDFVKIRSMLITHMQVVTDDVHYENYHSQKLASKGGKKLCVYSMLIYQYS